MFLPFLVSNNLSTSLSIIFFQNKGVLSHVWVPNLFFFFVVILFLLGKSGLVFPQINKCYYSYE